MDGFQASMQAYKQQLEKGRIQVAYRGLMKYFGVLRAHFKKNFPHFNVSGSVYYGLMDMTFFTLTPDAFKERRLKIPIVFLHEAWRFEATLTGANRDVQARYWDLIKDIGWDRYRLADDPRREEFVLAQTIIPNPDFSDLDALTEQIETGTLEFTRVVEGFLSENAI